MELTIRDWMVIIGAVLILAVLVDAARRVVKDRRSEVRLNAKINRRDEVEDVQDEFNLLAELPNGGARIVRRADLAPDALLSAPPESDTQEAEVAPEPVMEQAAPEFVEAAPVEAVEDARDPESDGLVAGFSTADDPVETLDWLDELDVESRARGGARAAVASRSRSPCFRAQCGGAF